MIRIASYRHSRNHKSGLPAIVGPRTYTNSRRRWQARILVDLPCAVGAAERPVVRLTINTPVMRYSEAAALACQHLDEVMRENAEWTDFSWEVWA